MKRSLPKANIEKSKPLVLVASDKAQNGTRAIHTTSLPEHTVSHFLVFLDSYLFFLPARLPTHMGCFTSYLHQFHFLFLTHQHILSQ